MARYWTTALGTVGRSKDTVLHWALQGTGKGMGQEWHWLLLWPSVAWTQIDSNLLWLVLRLMRMDSDWIGLNQTDSESFRLNQLGWTRKGITETDSYWFRLPENLNWFWLTRSNIATDSAWLRGFWTAFHLLRSPKPFNLLRSPIPSNLNLKPKPSKVLP